MDKRSMPKNTKVLNLSAAVWSIELAEINGTILSRTTLLQDFLKFLKLAQKLFYN